LPGHQNCKKKYIHSIKQLNMVQQSTRKKAYRSSAYTVQCTWLQKQSSLKVGSLIRLLLDVSNSDLWQIAGESRPIVWSWAWKGGRWRWLDPL